MTTANKDIKKPREFLNALLTALNGIQCPLEEPWATHFNALKANYNSVLENLPPSDMVPAATEANWNLGTLLSCLYSAQSLVTSMGQTLSDVKGKMTDALSSINSKAEALLADKLKTGDLVPKETVTALCSDVKAKALEDGRNEGRTEVRTEVAKEKLAAKTIIDRRALLATNSLPLPENDSVLGGTEEEFTALQAKAKTRIELLKGKGVSMNSKLLPKVWLPDNEFSVVETLITENMSRGAEPFAGGPSPGSGAAHGNPSLGFC